ncbi:MAG: hypothetical protein MJ057_06330 [Sphaerochaetaceae bacterium]|nr:hypothetical protein [Sphaerochaetaceae bacterium]
MKKPDLLAIMSSFENTLRELHAKIESKHMTPGNLRIEKRMSRILFFHRQNGSDKRGKYIKKENVAFAIQLAQQDYEKKVLSAVKKTEAVIKTCIKQLAQCTFPDEIYNGLSKERRELVTPVDSDDAFVRAWLGRHTYSPGYFDKDMPYYETDRGDRVRSKTEQMMANMFRASGIAYVVEPVVKTKGKVRRPDFLVLNRRTRQEFYIEHMGMMDDPAYVAENMQKVREYEDVGIYQGKNLILMFSDLKHPIDSRRVKRMIDRVLT